MGHDKVGVIGVDLGGTKVAGGLFLLDGTQLKKKVNKLDGRVGNDVGVLIVKLVNELMALAKKEEFLIKAVGICVPGISDEITQTVWAPNISGWESYPLRKVVEEGINEANVPVFVDNDRSCSILAEVWKGKAKNCDNALFITVGTGIGVGILADGKVLNGANGIAGSIGWLGMDVNFSNKSHQGGNLEHYASGGGISDHAKTLLKESPEMESTLRSLDQETLSTEDVFEAYGIGDSVAVFVLDTAVKYWGMCTGNLISIFNPEKIIFGGGVFGPGSQFLEEIKLESKRWAQPISFGNVTVDVSGLGGDAGLIGAGYLALTSLNKSE
ncbi:ROK family protein [Flagellimonas alvinocaridis]|uniref:ROK family protein n=1 Tax=Flagellimonas alvinocaridis TaxID=2530200 RepID=A0A4S8RND2_9FLAO|nr:ROK family protein [Allomuricauda alvinocaridis]THV60097.1 ROK family protein [Allomuricauda alvinocaridis]